MINNPPKTILFTVVTELVAQYSTTEHNYDPVPGKRLCVTLCTVRRTAWRTPSRRSTSSNVSASSCRCRGCACSTCRVSYLATPSRARRSFHSCTRATSDLPRSPSATDRPRTIGARMHAQRDPLLVLRPAQVYRWHLARPNQRDR
jgi:hypothetical protein